MVLKLMLVSAGYPQVSTISGLSQVPLYLGLAGYWQRGVGSRLRGLSSSSRPDLTCSHGVGRILRERAKAHKIFCGLGLELAHHFCYILLTKATTKDLIHGVGEYSPSFNKSNVKITLQRAKIQRGVKNSTFQSSIIFSIENICLYLSAFLKEFLCLFFLPSQIILQDNYLYYFIFKIYLFIFGCLGSSLLHGLSLVAVSGGYSLLWCAGVSLWWPLVAEHRLQARSLQQLWLAGSRAQAQQLWRTGLVALRHVRSSQTRD